MGQKTHPTGFRVGIIKPWVSSWYAKIKEYGQFVAEDAKIRKFVKKKLYAAGVSRILIARKAQNTTITVITAKPGIVVGRNGQGIEELKQEISKYINRQVILNVVEVARINADAQLVSEAIAQQLEKRVASCYETSNAKNNAFRCTRYQSYGIRSFRRCRNCKKRMGKRR